MYSVIIDCIKPLKVSAKPKPPKDSIFWTLSLGPPKPRKPQTFKCKSLCNKLGIMFKCIHTFYYE